MAGQVRQGYMGVATLGGNQIRCTSFSVNPAQTLLFYNHVIGLKDTVPSDSSTKGEDLSAMNIQRRIWRPSTFIANGSVSFPLTENTASYVFDTSRKAEYFDADFDYYCEYSRTVKDCRVNSFDLTATAGEPVTVSLSVMGKEVTEGEGGTTYSTAEKIITWDKVIISADGIPDGLINSFSLKINNNLKPIYVNGETSTLEELRPLDIRVGMQEVSGTITVYLKAGQVFLDPGEMVTISVKIHTISIKITAVFTPSSMDGAVGPIMATIPFTGVDYNFSS